MQSGYRFSYDKQASLCTELSPAFQVSTLPMIRSAGLKEAGMSEVT